MLPSSGQISFSDIILEHRPNNTTVGSGLKPFLLNDYSAYSTSVGAPLQLSEFYSTSSSYNTTRFDVSTLGEGPNNLNWAANVFDIREFNVQADANETGGNQTVVTLTNGGTYRCRYYWVSDGNGTASLHGTGATSITNIQTGSLANGFFGPFSSPLTMDASPNAADYGILYVRVIRIA